MGYDIYKEVVQIGGDRICEVHCKENGEGIVHFPKFRDCLIQAGNKDRLIIEGALLKSADRVEAYKKNLTNLDRIFRG